MTAQTVHPATKARELITFAVSGQDFCMDIRPVREIRGWQDVTPLPHAPRDVLGVMNLRGAVVPIIDLSLRLDLGPCRHHPRNVIIIALIEARTIGFLVSSVSNIVTVAPDEIQPMPDMGAPATASLVEGIIPSSGKNLRVLDVAALGAILDPRRSVA